MLIRCRDFLLLVGGCALFATACPSPVDTIDSTLSKRDQQIVNRYLASDIQEGYSGTAELGAAAVALSGQPVFTDTASVTVVVEVDRAHTAIGEDLSLATLCLGLDGPEQSLVGRTESVPASALSDGSEFVDLPLAREAENCAAVAVVAWVGTVDTAHYWRLI